jgi:putative ABC transport system permease protein
MRRSLRSWLWRVPIDREVDEELAFHIEMRTRELVERGMDPAAARELVLSRIGDIGQLKRTCEDLGRKRDREMRLTQFLDELSDDVTGAFRQMRASPSVTFVAVLTLALGIGANSAIFALADATFLRPLPFTQPPDRLTMLWEIAAARVPQQTTPGDYHDWSDQNQTFDAMAAFIGAPVTMRGPDGTLEQIQSQQVTDRFFDVLGVAPIAGRTFIASDAAAPSVVVVSERFWRQRFGADPTLVGRSIVLSERPLTVVGIVPDRFQLVPSSISPAAVQSPELWILFNVPRQGGPFLRSAHYLFVVGRLKPGVPLETAQRDMTSIADRNAELFPATNKGHRVVLQPLREALIGSEMRLTSMLLLGVVGFVLLMCCTNVANLLLARTTARSRELAVRSALGATRRRVVAQLLTESLVLATLGGLAGLAVGAAILQLAPSLVPPGLLPSAVALTFDGRVAAFCLVTALGVGLLFGMIPAWQSTGASMMQVMVSDTRTTTRGGRFRNVFVVVEVAAAVLVLSGAGLLLRTLIALQSMDPGYRAQDVLTMIINLPMPGPGSKTRYTSPELAYQFYDAVTKEVEQIPDVQSVSWGGTVPLDGMWFGMQFAIEGDPPKPEAMRDIAVYHMVSPEYFQTFDIPLVKGRAFTRRDAADAVQVCIVSEAFVQRYLGGREPIGMRVAVPPMGFGSPMPIVREIVGVAKQVKSWATETEPMSLLYVPLAQNPYYLASLNIRPRSGRADALLPAVRAAVARIDKDRALTRVRTIETVASEATSRPRFRAMLVGTFAVLALALAMVGVFGVLAYSVQQRVREFGVRMAMGASGSDVIRLVVGSAARLTVIGVAIGLVGAAVSSRWLATLVFPIAPLDPLTFAVVPLVLVIAVIVAVAAPAWRAIHVDPVVAFRSE